MAGKSPKSPGSSSSSRKRTASIAGLNNSGGVKRRASKACHSCRARKVRCDVIENGSPCTNCRLDTVDCVVTDSRRGKRPYQDVDILSKSSPSSVGNADDLPICMTFEPEFKDELPLSPDSLLNTSIDGDESHHVPHLLYQSRMKTPSNYFSRKPRLPNYIKPLPSTMLVEDIEYLDRKGAFTVPEINLRNELLRSYIQYIHPFMPIVDLKTLLTPIEEDAGAISLLLFQAIMFAGTTFIDLRFLQYQGFESRKAARKAFFQRVRLLYDFDYESESIPLVQSLLLLTYWYDQPDDHKHTWHWMGVSLSIAYTAGLHRNPERSNMDLQTQRLWKRIWWSCFIRDRLIALGTRRPPRIRNGDFDVPMLTEDDFELDPLPLNLVKLLGEPPSIVDSNKRKTLAMTCIELAKLTICVSHVLASQYTLLGHNSKSVESKMMLIPKKSARQVQEAAKCDEELEHWFQELPTNVKYKVSEKKNMVEDPAVNLHRAELRMIYLATMSALHRPQVFQSIPNIPKAVESQKASSQKVRQAAVEITDTICELFSLDQIRFMSTSCVPVLVPAILTHLLDMRSKDDLIRNDSTRRFYQCMKALQRLREVYASADSATLFLESAIRKAHIDIPALKEYLKLEFQIPTNVRYVPLQQKNQHTPVTKVETPDLRLVPEETPLSIETGIDDLEDTIVVRSLDFEDESRDDLQNESHHMEPVFDCDLDIDLFGNDNGLGLDLEVDWMSGYESFQADQECDC